MVVNDGDEDEVGDKLFAIEMEELKCKEECELLTTELCKFNTNHLDKPQTIKY